MTRTARNPFRRVRWALILGLPVVLALAGLGWHWQATLRCARIAVTGAQQVPADTLVALARVDTGAVLYDLDPVLLEDRLRRHPWVASARVRRLPTGTLALHVQERTPVALVLDAHGRPDRYLDGTGAQLPLVPGAAFDVPLVRGLDEPYHPVRPVQQPALRGLLAALARLDPATEALVAEVDLRPPGEVWLHTTPAAGHPSIPVRLGREAFDRKLARLRAFWRQAVLPRPDTRFRQIDLRFDGQIVTREQDPASG